VRFLSFNDYTIQIIDEIGELAKAQNIERRAQQLESALQKVDTHSKLTANQVASVFNTSFNLFQNVLNVFGVSIPPIAGALINSLVSMASAYSAAAAASAAGHDYIAASIMGMAVIAMTTNIIGATAANTAAEKALNESQRLAQSFISFANSWRFLY
jgi:hypothetical protein